MSAANRYRLVVGELGPGRASAFHAMTSRAHDGETAVTGPISDQSRLHGLIERLDGLGLTRHCLTPHETDNIAADADAPFGTQPAGSDHSPGAHSKVNR
jgi:hypothetical protein